MDIERITGFDSLVFYRVKVAGAILAITPREAIALLRYLSEHEDAIVRDALDNDAQAGMREFTDVERRRLEEES